MFDALPKLMLASFVETRKSQTGQPEIVSGRASAYKTRQARLWGAEHCFENKGYDARESTSL